MLIDLFKYMEKRKEIDRRQAIFFGAIIGIILFLFGVMASFWAGLIFGALGFGIIFGLVYGVTTMQNNTIVKKLRDKNLDVPCFIGNFRGEGDVTPSLVSLYDDMIVIEPLIKFSGKKIEVEITEDLFMAYGGVKVKALHKYRFGDVTQGHMTLNQMPHGPYRQFTFYNIDNLEDRLGERLMQISKFNQEKYQ